MTVTRSSARSRARKGQGPLLREQIITAAFELLLERGSVDNVSIRDVADRVGVTPPAIYLHFEDKERLFYECCRQGFEAFAARLTPIIGGAGSPIERIRRLGEGYIAFGLENWQQHRVLFGGGRPHQLPEGELDPGQQVLAGLVGLVAEAQAAGEIRSDYQPAAVAVALWAAVHGAVEVLLIKRSDPHGLPIPDEEAVISATLAMALEGLAGPPEGAGIG